MIAKSTSAYATPKARSRRKLKSILEVTNLVFSIIYIDPEHRKQHAH